MKKVGPRLYVPVLIAATATFSPTSSGQEIDEVIVTARLQSSAQALLNERMEDDAVKDVIGSEMIGRIGDTTVAAALRRVAGLSLVNNKFVYVRGLGERYSSSTLNGAVIPSPDLTRNVIPLDIFPTSIVESLSVQKSYAPEQRASFGGGNIDIRTKGIPDAFTWSIEASGGVNSEVSDLISYNGSGDDDLGSDDGKRALSLTITEAITRFRGTLNANGILNTLLQESQDVTLADAQDLNREIALALNRDISISPVSDDPDFGIKASMGNNFFLDRYWEVGFQIAAGYSAKWRKTETLSRDFGLPDEQFERESETTRSVDLNGNANFGVRFTQDHEITTTHLFVRNTDDETSVTDRWTDNFQYSDYSAGDGRGLRDSKLQFEEREMTVHQIKGEHLLGFDTRDAFPSLPLDMIPEGLTISWQYSEAEASTSIPNEVTVRSSVFVDSPAQVNLNQGADYKFTDLDDEVLDYSGQVMWPMTTDRSRISITAGGSYSRKVRTYRETTLELVPNAVGNVGLLSRPFGEIFSDENIMGAANDYQLNLNLDTARSYIAATITDGAFGQIDWIWNETWRFAAGARWESYRQVSLPWNLYAFDLVNPAVTTDPAALEQAVFSDDSYYPSVSLTYMTSWWADVFQLRFGWSETVVRPDLREITETSYLDARTDYVTEGCPECVPSDVTNLDLRAEWFFSSGDNLTVTLFHKDLDNPIEFFEFPASDTNRGRLIDNAESGSVSGIEVEALKQLGFLGEFWDAFFLQGNLTLQDSELVVGTLRSNVTPTNSTRKLAGASDYVVNVLLGYDSLDGRHASTLTYNVFGERLFAAGRNPTPDIFEQPFDSLDLTYQWYPTDTITVKAKLQNILDEETVFEQSGIETFVEKPGRSWSVSANWSF